MREPGKRAASRKHVNNSCFYSKRIHFEKKVKKIKVRNCVCVRGLLPCHHNIVRFGRKTVKR